MQGEQHGRQHEGAQHGSHIVNSWLIALLSFSFLISMEIFDWWMMERYCGFGGMFRFGDWFIMCIIRIYCIRIMAFDYDHWWILDIFGWIAEFWFIDWWLIMIEVTCRVGRCDKMWWHDATTWLASENAAVYWMSTSQWWDLLSCVESWCFVLKYRFVNNQ